ncbi:MAG: Gfo/Idh/MocA family protein [bacterium]
MRSPMDRRTFLSTAALGTAGLVVLRDSRSARGAPANDKLDVALVGVFGRGRWFVQTMPRLENVVALCDVNDRKFESAWQFLDQMATSLAKSERDYERRAAAIYQRLLDHKPKTFYDFRKMLDEMDEQIDAVVVATPDNTHAVVSAAAMRAGKHVYCEKPLTHDVYESRALREIAREQKVATEMGNQGTASGQFRRGIELVRDGTLGRIQEVIVWNNGGGPDRPEAPKGSQPEPEWLRWDLWLGPAKDRPFHTQWLRWHAWRDFATGQLGNWASHSANLAFMALKVDSLWHAEPEAKPRLRIQAKTNHINPVSFPRWEIITWDIPARADLPPIRFTWYNGGRGPGVRQAIEEKFGEKLHWGDAGPPEWRDHAGALILGTKGRLHATGHNATIRLLPEEDFKGVDISGPKTLPRSHGHERDWLIACRGGDPPWSSFDYAGPLNEFLQLGNVATLFEGELEFDPLECKIVNHGEADAALRREYRAGWSL